MRNSTKAKELNADCIGVRVVFKVDGDSKKLSGNKTETLVMGFIKEFASTGSNVRVFMNSGESYDFKHDDTLFFRPTRTFDDFLESL